MNLQQLEYLVALDQYKSFSKAAEVCFITQATLSTMIKKLEAELDMVLFDRKNNPIITTECGKVVVEEAKSVLKHTHRIKGLQAELQGNIEGEIAIGIIPTIAGNLLHRLIPVVLHKYPKLKLIIKEITTENIVQQIKQGTLDAGIITTPIVGIGLEEELLYYELLMLYGNLEQIDLEYLSPKDLNHQKLWLLEQGNCLNNQVVNLCALTRKPLNENLDFHPNSFDSLLSMVDSVDGLTVVPELFVLDLPERRKSKIKAFQAPHPVREVSLVYHRPFAKKRFIDLLVNEIQALIKPLLKTQHFENKDMQIADI